MNPTGSGPQGTFGVDAQNFSSPHRSTDDPTTSIKKCIEFFLNLKNRHGNTKLSSVFEEIEQQALQLERKFLQYKSSIETKELLCASLEQQVRLKDRQIAQAKHELDSVKVQKFDAFSSQMNVAAKTSHTPGMPACRSYAQCVSQSDAIPPVKTNHVVIIQPKSDSNVRDGNATLQMFKATVKHKILKDEKIGIKKKKLTSKNRLVVSCGSDRECEALCKAMAQNEYLVANVPKKKKPLVQILGVDQEVERGEVFQYMISQNPVLQEFSDCHFETKFDKTDRLGSKFVVAEVDPKLYKKLMQMKSVFIGLSLCPVKTRINVTRCYKCNFFGHVKAKCTNVAMCVVCGGPHENNKCTHTVRCSNCAWVNRKREQRGWEQISCDHRADDKNCPQYLRMCKIVESQYDFG